MPEFGQHAPPEWRPHFRIGIIVAATVAVTITYANIPSEQRLLSKLVQYLYFLPTLMAALWFGWRGALASATFAALCYMPRILLFWHSAPGYQSDQYSEVVDLFLIGAIIGVLADRDRRRRVELEATTSQLSRTYRELQENFEHLKRAERFSAIGQMAAGLAHEIRNPLAAIEGAADLLTPGAAEQSGQQAMQQEFVGIIKKECRRLSRLLTGMLDFARPRTPQFQFTSVAPLLESVISLITAFAQKSGVTIQWSIEPALPAIACDPEQIKQVFLNLAMNAVQAMNNQGTLAITAARRAGSIVIEVRDEGPGIAPENLDKVFSPFFTTKTDGTGLGLPIAQQIVVRHGGVIMADPNTPRGTVFTVVLPVERPRTAL
ncbi:MAG: sensor histidine kinase [Bryobacterales bacterium]|nr:sensor histidine kinase [Bryobacterales bacterium]